MGRGYATTASTCQAADIIPNLADQTALSFPQNLFTAPLCNPQLPNLKLSTSDTLLMRNCFATATAAGYPSGIRSMLYPLDSVAYVYTGWKDLR